MAFLKGLENLVKLTAFGDSLVTKSVMETAADRMKALQQYSLGDGRWVTEGSHSLEGRCKHRICSHLRVLFARGRSFQARAT